MGTQLGEFLHRNYSGLLALYEVEFYSEDGKIQLTLDRKLEAVYIPIVNKSNGLVIDCLSIGHGEDEHSVETHVYEIINSIGKRQRMSGSISSITTDLPKKIQVTRRIVSSSRDKSQS